MGTTNRRYMLNTLDVFDALADRDAEDREPDVETDPLYGLPWQGILDALYEYGQEALTEAIEREWLSRERYAEYWGE